MFERLSVRGTASPPAALLAALLAAACGCGDEAASPNRGPLIGLIQSLAVEEGQLLSYGIPASDPDGDPLTYRVLSAPAGVAVGASSGELTWTPSFDQAGTHDVVVEVVDVPGRPGARSVRTAVRIDVLDVNRLPVAPPIGTIPAEFGVPLSHRVQASDPDGDPLRWEAVTLPPGAAVDATNGRLDWTPGPGSLGEHAVVVAVFERDRPSARVTTGGTVAVAGPNGPPRCEATGVRTIREGEPTVIDLVAEDPDGDAVTFEVDEQTLPAGATLDAAGRFAWTPGYDQAGDYHVELSVVDDASPPHRAACFLDLSVRDVNRPPVLVYPAVTRTSVGVPVRVVPEAVDDPDGDAVRLQHASLPPGARFDADDGAITWTPGFDDGADPAAPHDFRIVAADDRTPPAKTTARGAIEVLRANQPPAVEQAADVDATVLVDLAVPLRASDPDDDPIAWRAAQMPAGMALDGATGLLTWRPAAGQVGDHRVAVVAADDGTPPLSDTAELIVHVHPDTDGDGVGDHADLCADVPDPAQADADLDDVGDACDACPDDPTNDEDGDGACNEPPLGFTFGGATGAATDAPGVVTVLFDPPQPEGRIPVRLQVAVWLGWAEDGVDTDGEPVAVVSGDAHHATVGDLPPDRTAFFVARGRNQRGATDDNAVVVSASTSLPALDVQAVWQVQTKWPTVTSSAALAQLDDGPELDVVVGGGGDSAVGTMRVLSGADGSVVWAVENDNEVMSSAVVVDLNDDGVPDIVDGGRMSYVWALDGRNGDELWRFEVDRWTSSPALIVRDDGTPEIVVVGGGYGEIDLDGQLVVGGIPRWREGRIYHLDGRTGRELGRYESPWDEFYSSPAIGDLDGDGGLEVVVGSGGHVEGGEAIAVSMDDWSVLWTHEAGEAAGMMCSAGLADLDGDGLLDVVIGTADHYVAALRGTDGETLWRIDLPEFEVMGSPALGWPDRSGVPRVAVAAGLGDWHDGYTGGGLAVVDGATGEVLWRRVTDFWFQLSTPIWVDLTGNGLDDLVLSESFFGPHNHGDGGGGGDGHSHGNQTIGGRIVFVHGLTGEVLAELEHSPGDGVTPSAALLGTPVVADLDFDGFLDVVWAGFYGTPSRDEVPLGPMGSAGRYRLSAPVPPRGISWRSFRGDERNRGILMVPPP